MTIYDQGKTPNTANFDAFVAVSMLRRAAMVCGDKAAVCYGDRKLTWAAYSIAASMLPHLPIGGIKRGDTVAIISANIPEMFEAHYAVPMAGAC